MLLRVTGRIVFVGLSLILPASASWGANVPAVPAPTATPVTTTLPNQPNASPGTPGTTLSNPANGNFGMQTGTGATAPEQGTIGGPGGPSGQFAAYGSTYPVGTPRFGSGLANTAHDFSGGAIIPVGMCTFCHTPHKASSTLLLWNHTLSNNPFSWEVAATTAGTALPGFSGNTYKGPSARCLSCHDGSVAIGDIGWFDEAVHQGGSKVLWGKMTNVYRQVGVGGNLTGTHPVAIPYPLNGAPNVYNGSTTGARLATNDFQSDPTANNMRLYSDVGGGQIVGKVQAGKTGIECSSCHDPHNKAANEDYFLRAKLRGSSQTDGYICLQCHVK